VTGKLSAGSFFPTGERTRHTTKQIQQLNSLHGEQDLASDLSSKTWMGLSGDLLV
jgi:hypothetical protein